MGIKYNSEVLICTERPLTAYALNVLSMCEYLYCRGVCVAGRGGNPTITLHKSQLTELLGIGLDRISAKTLRDISCQLRGIRILIPGDFSFYQELVSVAAYCEGTFIISFNAEPIKSLMNSDYIESFDYRNRIRWVSSYSHLMYDNLAYVYIKCKNASLLEQSGGCKLYMSVGEFRHMMQLINLYEPRLQEMVKNGITEPDELYAASRYRRYSSFAELYRKVIEPAVKEINNCSRTNFSINVKRVAGPHNITKELEFIIYPIA